MATLGQVIEYNRQLHPAIVRKAGNEAATYTRWLMQMRRLPDSDTTVAAWRSEADWWVKFRNGEVPMTAETLARISSLVG